MTKIKRLRPPPPPPLPLTPQCEAYRRSTYCRDDGQTFQCTRKSSYLIDGEHLCVSHAKDAALEILLNEADE